MKKNIILILSIGCVGAFAINSAKYDLLGRNVSKSASPLVYKTNVLLEKKNKSFNALAKQSETKITPINGAFIQSKPYYKNYAHYYVNENYELNGKSVSKKQYFESVNDYERNYPPRKNYNAKGESFEKRDWEGVYSVKRGTGSASNKAKSPYEKNVVTEYYNFDWAGGWSGKIFPRDFVNGSFYLIPNSNDRIGVYLVGDTSPYDASSNKVLNACKKGDYIYRYDQQADILGVRSVLNHFSSNSDLFYYDYECDKLTGATMQYPVRPDVHSIHMGVHVNSLAADEVGDGKYNERAAYLDDYIYENRMIEIVAAGNLATTPTSNNGNGFMRKSASALNAITVGAVDVGKNQITAYSSWKNPQYTSGEKKSFDKPEIYGYTNFYTTEKNYIFTNKKSNKTYERSANYGGTETAAAYIGGMVESLLSYEPFYKWHPEVVKALLLTSSNINVLPTSYRGNDFLYTKDNKNLVIGATNYLNVFMGNTSRYWIANTASEFMKKDKDGKYYLEFKEDVTSYESQRIAISWLSKSSYAKSKGRTPQDFDIFIYDEKGKEIAKSTTGDNPFELVDFSTSSDYVTVKIKLDRNDGERIILGYNFFDWTKVDYSMLGEPVGF